MDRRDFPPLRSLPRIFLDDLDPESLEIELPKPEYRKLHDVLRLRAGAHIALLPGDGTVWRCEFHGPVLRRLEIETIHTEPTLELTLAQAMPKAEKLEEVIRMGTEIGVSHFQVFDSDRTVVRWDERKKQERLPRLAAIARESAEQSYRARVPSVEFVSGLDAVLRQPEAIVLSEVDRVTATLQARLGPEVRQATLVVGPEGGWSPREVAAIGDRAVTLGPRVLRVDTAAAAAAALVLLRAE
jgi:16S rRNA (uracil1498-N3)-methyltransferase